MERELSLSHRGYALFAFTLPLLGASLLEAAILVRSDRWDRTRLLVAGQAVLCTSLGLCAWAPSPWVLAFGLALAGASSGVACGAAQGALLSARPGDEERVMARWTIGCAVGDVLTPLVTAAALAAGASYRSAMGSVAVLVGLQGTASWLSLRGVPGERATPEGPSSREPLRLVLERALRMPALWAWLAAAASCTLLDEIIVALAVLRQGHGGMDGTRGALATGLAMAFSAGATVGAVATDRLLSRMPSRVLLLGSAAACAAALGAFVIGHGVVVGTASLFVLGLTSAPHHPLCQARAYASLADRPGTVHALGQVFGLVDVAAPLVLGVIADRWGLDVALACLLVQPLAVGAMAVRIRK